MNLKRRIIISDVDYYESILDNDSVLVGNVELAGDGDVSDGDELDLLIIGVDLNCC